MARFGPGPRLMPNDPFVRGRNINDQFQLHVLATGGPPMVHLTNCKKTEVVLFGADQELVTPLFGPGRHAHPGDRTRRERSKSASAVSSRDRRISASSFPLRLEDVILAMTELGAQFPGRRPVPVRSQRPDIIWRDAWKSTPCPGRTRLL